MSVSPLFAHYRMTEEQRERAKRAAEWACGLMPNGPAAGELRQASLGSNEEMLLGIALILQRMDDAAKIRKLTRR